ncbi:MAG TPA: orotate phosphoribosyltransferase [Candidatus Nanoarchaeia archaeon]|nr:orotate phosphoribosyltransferase [Candidatus Nanoarchaeia archaeon]
MPSKEVAKILLKQKAVLLRPDNPFTWSSGIKSPIYTDNRKLISSVDEREKIVSGLVSLAKKEKFDVIAGTATAGIPWAAFVAQKLKKPMIYVRSKPKEHGTGSSIEGELKKGQRVIVIEDLISTGSSSLSVVAEIRKAGGIVKSTVGIFSYGFKSARDGFGRAKLKLVTLTDFSTLIKEAVREKYITEKQKSIVESWRKQFL